MRRILLAATVIGLGAMPASAAVILSFGQTAGTPITATENGAQTATTLSATDAAISITQIENGSPTAAFFDLSAASVGAAQPILGGSAQKFSGTFSITSAAGGAGTELPVGHIRRCDLRQWCGWRARCRCAAGQPDADIRRDHRPVQSERGGVGVRGHHAGIPDRGHQHRQLHEQRIGDVLRKPGGCARAGIAGAARGGVAGARHGRAAEAPDVST